MDCWSPSLVADDEFEKLAMKINPSRVTVDNASSRKTTLIRVDSANKRGSLLELVQGNKLFDDGIAECIQQSLGPRGRSFPSLRRSVGVQAVHRHRRVNLLPRPVEARSHSQSCIYSLGCRTCPTKEKERPLDSSTTPTKVKGKSKSKFAGEYV
ncbi:hypothetical protein ACFX1T_003442 [Malus domestica]